MKTKRIITLILAALLLISIMPFAASASEWGMGDTLEDALAELKVGFYPKLLDWLSIPGFGVIQQRYTYYLYRNTRTGTVDEQPVYCIDPTRGGANSIVADVGPNDDGSNTATYIRGERVADARYKAILANGYPHMRLESLGLQTKEEGYYATKVALWMYIRGVNPAQLAINSKYGNSDPVAQRLREAAIEIFYCKQGALVTPRLILTGIPNSLAQLDAAGEYYIQKIEVFANTWTGLNPSVGTVNLRWSSPPPAGTVVLGSNGEDISGTMAVLLNVSGSYAGQQGSGYYGIVTVKYPASQIDSETFAPPALTAEALMANDDIYIAYAKVNKDRYQRYLVERDPKTLMTASFVSQISAPMDVDIPYETALRIRKVQAGTDLPLAGAVFEVRDPDGKLICSLATGANGIIDIPLSVTGNYTVTEIQPPLHHLPASAATQSVTVRHGELAEVTFANEPYGSLRIMKRDSFSGAPLGGAAVRIRNIATNATQEGYTDSSGNIVFNNLPVGAYEIVEVISPEGYALDTTVHTVNVVPLSKGEVSYLLTNKANPSLRIVKFDRQSMTPIAGVTFEVWHDGTLYGTYLTDAWGEITLRNIPAGTWIARETATVEPYVIDRTAQWIEISAGQGYISELFFFNVVKPGIRVLKVDAETYAPLANAVYRISQVGGPFTNEYLTDINGEIDLSALDPGTYIVEETAAPSGYLIDDARRTILINAGETAQFTFTNSRKPELEILKFDGTSYLPGATFRIARIEDGSRYLDRITDENGRIRIDGLEPGVYSVQEQAAPNGYILNDTIYNVQLFPGRTSTVVVNNMRKPSLIVWKFDELTAAPLPDAEFSIAKKGGSVIFEGVTNSEGFIRLDDLDSGWYTVTEMAPPPGYLLSTQGPRDVYLEGGAITQIKFDNLKCPVLTIIKTDSLSGSPIRGVKMNVKFSPAVNFSGGVVDLGDYLTDENGRIVLSGNLQSGWYRITELEAAPGYVLEGVLTQDVFLRGGDSRVVYFENTPKSGLLIVKYDSYDKTKTLSGAVFSVTDSAGRFVGNSNGRHTTDAQGQILISGLLPGTYVVTEVSAPSGYVLNATPQTIKVDAGGGVYNLSFYNDPLGGLEILKIDEVTRQPIPGTEFAVTKLNGERISANTYITDSRGIIRITGLTDGWYTVTETKAAKGYILDPAQHNVEVKNGVASLRITNHRESGILLHKVCSATGRGLYGVKFLISDALNNPIRVETSDQNGYIYTAGLTDGKYFIREIEAARGYILDTETKTFYIQYGETKVITWANTPMMGQIQITKKSADDNPINGFPAGTLLQGAVFEIYDRANNLADRIISDRYGLAVSRTLPLGRYTIREVTAPSYYMATQETIAVEIEFSSQIIHMTVLNKSVYTNVSVSKRGYAEVVPGQQIRYDFRNIANNSTVPLDSFYWRDTLPTDAVRLGWIITGTWSHRLNYRVVYKTNISAGEYRTLADNLSTDRIYSLDTSPAALSLASNEFITEFMFVFGRVPAGFRQVDAPYIFCTVLQGLEHEYRFTNKTDVGGLWGNQWVMFSDRWVTVVFNNANPPSLPRTGY